MFNAQEQIRNWNSRFLARDGGFPRNSNRCCPHCGLTFIGVVSLTPFAHGVEPLSSLFAEFHGFLFLFSPFLVIPLAKIPFLHESKFNVLEEPLTFNHLVRGF
ncbi:hypothetical protein CEXT_297981 [Caerostris extrusa]|uniref:Uncharacterized protein n=1 Tax=Caerostris extrusa TaxID=172846 RepID=A0AAV4XPH2_CAEEX|nr:hypothetical protein CEXT_297981 [Caerostris extrusa]